MNLSQINGILKFANRKSLITQSNSTNIIKTLWYHNRKSGLQTMRSETIQTQRSEYPIKLNKVILHMSKLQKLKSMVGQATKHLQ